MRKIFIFLLLSTFLVFSACTEQQTKTADINYCIHCTADISCNGEEVNCALSRDATSRASIKFLSPEYYGLTYYWSGKDFSISYSGLSAISSECILPQTSFAVQILKVLDYAESNKDALDKQGDNVTGSLNGFDFTINAENSTGLIKSILISQNNTIVKLYDHT